MRSPDQPPGYGPLGSQRGGQIESSGPGAGHRSKRKEKTRAKAQAREARWQNNRMAVPYPTDGPKVTFGLLWFAAIVGATVRSPLLVALLASMVAALAGLQAGHAWLPRSTQAKIWTAVAAFATGIGGFLGPFGIVAGGGAGVILLLVYAILYPSPTRPAGSLADILLRSSLPVGIAAGSMAALGELELGALLALIGLVSAYEMGDFLVGSGSMNAIEGPISGLVGLGAVLFCLWIVSPSPFTAKSMLMFGALTAVCCPLGQITASALLPRGAAWAPALRRLDSYLLAAPLWLLLLTQTTTADRI